VSAYLVCGKRKSSLKTNACEMEQNGQAHLVREFFAMGPALNKKIPLTFEHAQLKAASYIGRNKKLVRLIKIASSRDQSSTMNLSSHHGRPYTYSFA
jgi:hypothetical protein